MSSIRRNSFANVAGRLATAGLWIVATPFVLRHLGAERFGIWSLFFAFNGYLASFDLGIGNTLLRFIAAQRPANDRGALLRTLSRGLRGAVALGLVWALAIELARGWIAATFHVPPAMMPEALDALQVFGLGVLLLFPSQALTSSLQGFERIDLANICTSLGIVLHVTGIFVALTLGGGLRGVALAGVIGQLVTMAVAALMIHAQLRRVSPGTGAGAGWREMLGFSAALQMVWILIMLQIQLPRTMLGILGNLTLVADYELAFRVASTIATIPILIRDPVIPVVSRIWHHGGRDEVAALFTSTSRWVYLYGAMALGLLWLTAGDLARLWLGPGHERIADLMRLWVIAYAANLAYAPGVAIARGMGTIRFEIASYAAALATNFGLAFLWIPKLGAAGAVFAVAVSYAIGFVVFVLPFHRFASPVTIGAWFVRGLAPRAAVGTAVVAVSSWILASVPALRAAAPGLRHAIAAVMVFGVVFLLAFLLTGDTQRLARVVWKPKSGLGPVGGEIPSS